jgi:hypothetical protein
LADTKQQPIKSVKINDIAFEQKEVSLLNKKRVFPDNSYRCIPTLLDLEITPRNFSETPILLVNDAKPFILIQYVNRAIPESKKVRGPIIELSPNMIEELTNAFNNMVNN